MNQSAMRQATWQAMRRSRRPLRDIVTAALSLGLASQSVAAQSTGGPGGREPVGGVGAVPAAQAAWTLSASVSELTDDTTLVLSTRALAPAVVRSLSDPELMVRCGDGALAVFLVTGEAVAADAAGAATVRFRLDRQPLDTARWHEGRTGTTLFAPAPDALLAQLLQAEEFRIEWQPALDDAVVARFALSGLKAHEARLRAACPPKRAGPQTAAGAAGAPEAASEVVISPELARALGIVTAPVEPVEAFYWSQVQKTAIARPGNPAPQFPSLLQEAGIEGEVLAQFVIDTSGRADMRTFKVIASSHVLFTQAVRYALPDYRYYPAEIGGRKVKQLVQQPFIFALNTRVAAPLSQPCPVWPLGPPVSPPGRC